MRQASHTLMVLRLAQVPIHAKINTMRRWLLIPALPGLFLLGVLLGVLIGGDVVAILRPSPTPTWTLTPTFTPSPTPTETPTWTLTPTPTYTLSPPASPTSTATPTSLYTPTITLTPSRTHTVTLTPTYKPIAAIVQEQSHCRFGPGVAYLHEWTLYPDVRVDIIGRNNLGTWLYVDPWTYVGKCWVFASLLEIRGDLFDAPPYYSNLPFSALYKPPTGAHAVRFGNYVTISWNSVWMTEDDYRGYLIEAWLCQDGQLIFTPMRSDETTVVVEDEAGCFEPSSARLYTAEKHGYTQWVIIPWPPP